MIDSCTINKNINCCKSYINYNIDDVLIEFITHNTNEYYIFVDSLIKTIFLFREFINLYNIKKYDNSKICKLSNITNSSNIKEFTKVYSSNNISNYCLYFLLYLGNYINLLKHENTENSNEFISILKDLNFYEDTKFINNLYKNKNIYKYKNTKYFKNNYSKVINDEITFVNIFKAKKRKNRVSVGLNDIDAIHNKNNSTQTNTSKNKLSPTINNDYLRELLKVNINNTKETNQPNFNNNLLVNTEENLNNKFNPHLLKCINYYNSIQNEKNNNTNGENSKNISNLYYKEIFFVINYLSVWLYEKGYSSTLLN